MRRIEVRIVDPKRVAASPIGRTAAKNDTIDAEMIAWFAETFNEARGQAYDAAREQLTDGERAPGSEGDAGQLASQGEHTAGRGSTDARRI